ncbi:BREX-1 system adenine-specific DNA-methyltransferase PglX [Rhizobium sp. 'Codium 1']|uniref:BREX-1 system adenine-specific DNA-methyltransferase PglX n=1 Tax=Rhizobium sp. 'Codium 1' TaxID=2940484 RepID=UPI001E3B1162|nr:BREX-1 system adenine-specific DNA-methyltransferase PglX [Rhizobium sp. 'Codium 1']MCC8932262.1 BREX-1 system adenine-specific DNA-methyltransferase PglX [Rhizobium sp. 'Codium 1']
MTLHYLTTSLRRALEKTIKEARVIAEAGASDAIRRLGITEAKAPTYLSEEEKELRRRLRAHARTLGDRLDKDSDGQEVKRLTEAAAYAHWHRMLFARFLAERGLLRHPEHNVPVTLEDCREIAQENGLSDAWAVAERYASSMLPAVFRIDDPVLSVTLDAAQNQALHRLVTELHDDVFQAEDSLGWTYQFWRASEKDAVNKKGDKIGPDEISAVTQLFTEPYMVRFLLHNTLGAWWAGKVLARIPDLAKSAVGEDELRAACSLPGYSFDMLRFVREDAGDGAQWRPASGSFPGWPQDAKNITVLDPCCGSGHFLTEVLTILVSLRKVEEDLTAPDSVAAVLRDNLHGLEIDGRCVQIAAFAVALTAWRVGGWQTLPLPHIAWVGSPPPLPKLEFVALANGDEELEQALAALHGLFAQAPTLGSLLEPIGGDLIDPMRIARVEQLLEPLLEKARSGEAELAEGVIAARGMADAASFLTRKYTLQVTNVPFLGKGRQATALAHHLERYFDVAKTDLATAMLVRMFRLSSVGGSVAAVTPQGWLFLGSYKALRETILTQASLRTVTPLGSRAFETISGEVVNTVLFCADNSAPGVDHSFFGIDANQGRDFREKQISIRNDEPTIALQSQQLRNPDSRITVSASPTGTLLSQYADSYVGFQNGDSPRWIRSFWEQLNTDGKWSLFQMTSDQTIPFNGRTAILKWEGGTGELARSEQAFVKGREAWKRQGVIIRHMGSLPAGLYEGDLYDQSSAVIVPKREEYLPAIWAYCSSDDFHTDVRTVDQSLKVTNATLVKVPFDLAAWTEIASGKFVHGLPEPYSEDPTQWLFHGHPAKADKGTSLHVALARLCGYRWPAETAKQMRLSTEARGWITKASALPAGDLDGLLATAGVAGEKPLADRLRGYLAIAFGAEWSDALERRLVVEADEVLDRKQTKDSSLEGWLSDRAFRQHCALFHQRPFLWHVWDGLKDGFSVFVHYHRFTQANLRKLTYTTLGDWLRRAKDENNDLRYEKGRELQQMLENVLEGETPYDIFVRWKSLADQPLGWDPDLDDGVRVNIRPFVEAGILREQPKGIKWTKDRGNDVPSAPWYPVFKGERINHHHTTIEEKNAARPGNPEMVAAK